MPNDLSVDLGTVALLAIVVWLDGWRRLPADAVVVARRGLGRWSVPGSLTRIGPFALVASWAPVVVPLVLSPAAASAESRGGRWQRDFDLVVARTRRRLHRVRAVSMVLRALGVLLTVWIIAGIPVATARFGAPGLIHGVIGAFLLAIAMTFGATVASSALGIPVPRAFRGAAQLLSPFTAPRAVEIITGAAVGPLHSLAPLAALLGETHFLAWVRPWAYDELAGRHPDDRDPTIARLVAALPRGVLERAVAATIGDAGGQDTRYCPRCTRTYLPIVATCSHCDQLPLVTHHPPTATRESS